jgi:RNA polymerase sigma factor (sigma-70 family)
MAFAELYERHHQALYRYCRSIVRDEYDAQDALQSAMASAFAALRKGERDLAVRPWLFRIAHNESVSLLRRRRPLQVAADELALAAPANVSQPAEVLEQRERLAALVGDLRGLTIRQRSVLVMRELSGLSIAEIAAACSSTRGAVKQTLFEAREALRESERGRTMECEQVRRLIYEDDRRALRGRRVDSHLRACAGCAELAEAIATRRQDLRLLAPPLPAAAATALLSRLLEAGASVPAGAASASAASGAAGGAGAPSVAAHAGGAIGVKALTTAVVVAVGAAGVAGVTLSASRHGRAADRAGPSVRSATAAAHHAAVRVSAGSGQPAHGSPPRPHAGSAGGKRALAFAQARRAAASHADGRSGEAHESPDHSLRAPGQTRAPGQVKHPSAGQNPGHAISRGHRPRSRHAGAPNDVARERVSGRGRSEEHRSSAAPHATERTAHAPPARDRPKPAREALQSEAGSAEAPASGHGKGAH